MKLLIVFLMLLLSTSAVFAKSALIIVDMQNCFVPGDDKATHSLPVQGGLDIVKGINKIQKKFDIVVATKDWHPANHVSFASNHEGKEVFTPVTLEDGTSQVLWPDHCIPNTKGSEFVSGLKTRRIKKVIYKGQDPGVDSYSGFMNNNKKDMTELDSYLKAQGITEIYVVGLAADYCVKFTALDGAFLGYKTYFIKDLTKAVDPSKLNEVYNELEQSNVNIISAENI